MAKGDAAKGETAAAVCKVCHAFDAGAPSPIGPNLHNVVGRKIASVEGFNYSPALKAKSGEDWTYDNLEHFIHKPAEYAPGTLMAFPGIPDEQQLADVILFLRTKTDNPPPLPEVAAAPAPEAAPAGEAAKPAADPNVEVAALVAKADPAKGESAAAMCKVCHAVEKGAPSPVGPNLYGVIGRPIASVEGFNYSPALKAKASEGDWDYAHVDAFIHKPMEYAPGTMMAFPGIPDANQRAEVIAWLRTKADSPAPLPEAAAATPEAPKEEAPAEAAPAPAAEEEKPAEAAPPPTAEEKPAEPPAAPEAAEKPAEAAPAPMEEEKPAERHRWRRSRQRLLRPRAQPLTQTSRRRPPAKSSRSRATGPMPVVARRVAARRRRKNKPAVALRAIARSRSRFTRTVRRNRQARRSWL